MLYLCPTPIGNLEDITIRTLKVLGQVDYIACEDTRKSSILLNHYDISKPLISYHKFNMRSNGPRIINLLKEGKDLAYVSDAGMPGISDPGSELYIACKNEGLDATVLPGPSASITALVLSGLPNDRFTFIGFLPEKKTSRRKELELLKDYQETLIIYEAPHRLEVCLKDIYEIFGPRRIALVREISKVYEEVIQDNLENIINNIDQLTIKGEFVLLVEGGQIQEPDIDIEKELKDLMTQGHSKSQAVKILSKEYDLKRNEVYQISLKI